MVHKKPLTALRSPNLPACTGAELIKTYTIRFGKRKYTRTTPAMQAWLEKLQLSDQVFQMIIVANDPEAQHVAELIFHSYRRWV